MMYLYAGAAGDGRDWVGSCSCGRFLRSNGGFPLSQFWLQTRYLHRLDHDWASINGFQKMAGGGDCFCLVISRRIALGCDQQDLVSFIPVHAPQTLETTVPGRVEGVGQAENRRQSRYVLPLLQGQAAQRLLAGARQRAAMIAGDDSSCKQILGAPAQWRCEPAD